MKRTFRWDRLLKLLVWLALSLAAVGAFIGAAFAGSLILEPSHINWQSSWAWIGISCLFLTIFTLIIGALYYAINWLTEPKDKTK